MFARAGRPSSRELVIPSAMFYLGALLALAALASLVLPRLRRAGRGRKAVAIAAITGTGLALLGIALPSRDDVVVIEPRERLDAIMPRYLFRERHVITVAATPLGVDRAVRTVTADEIHFYRALTWLRRLGRRGPESLLDAPREVPMLALATRTGFQLLVDEPGREMVLGAAGPVSSVARAAARSGAPRPFVASADGYMSIAMNFHVTPDGRGGSVLSTETRVYAPDASTRRRLTTYWRVIYPGSTLIRRVWLAAIQRRAESGTTAGGRIAPASGRGSGVTQNDEHDGVVDVFALTVLLNSQEN
ncbi:MAG TPA: hypothetical protein VFO66_15130 [Gemmatimonadaceae bacterium]|nr:hypothetical protein [Gemmatimonadaceae bacterium]